MSDAPDEAGGAGAASNPAASAAGPDTWLKQERERCGLTTQRIAADMHLSVAVIDAIEANRFDSLGAPVFAKGHLRKYATLLGLQPSRATELYDQLENAPRAVDPVPVTQRAPEPALRPGIREMLSLSPDSKLRRPQVWPWVVGAVIVTVGIIAIAWWMLGRPTQRAVPPANPEPTPTTQTTPEKSQQEKTQQEKPAQAVASVPPPPFVATSTPTAATPQRPSRSSGTPPPGKVRVRLTFARESWVEVYDVNGNRMLYDVGRTDLPRMIDVEPPALVVLGDANAVSAEANDQVLAIPKKNISGTVARFTIAADGTVK